MIIIKWEKGLFRALGLHHAGITSLIIFVGYVFALGNYAAVACIAWYCRQEIKEYEVRRSNEFEIMDFVSPSLVACVYLYWI